MKKCLFIVVGLIPFLLNAQRVITLSVSQPPEFGFSISKKDTTINKGSSVALGGDFQIFGGSGDYSFLWTPSETLNDPTVKNPIATPVDTTTYQITITDKNGCSFSLSYTVNVKDLSVGLSNYDSHSSYDAILFPNPNDGKFKIKLSGPPTPFVELMVIDSGGRIIRTHTILSFTGNHTENLDMNLVSGLYIMRIIAGKEFLSRHFIIQ